MVPHQQAGLIIVGRDAGKVVLAAGGESTKTTGISHFASRLRLSG
jgi:hypothetical protein